MDYKKYIFSLRKFILASFLIFCFGAFYGYFFAQASPDETILILKDFQEMLEPILAMSSLSQFLFIFLNNGLTAFLAILFGIIFGIFPFLVLTSNGFILGIMAYFFKTELSLSVFFIGIAPHGIIEIPVIILATAIGLKLGRIFFFEIFKKQKLLKKELNLALIFFLKILLPVLVLAAGIEVFITSQLLK